MKLYKIERYTIIFLVIIFLCLSPCLIQSMGELVGDVAGEAELGISSEVAEAAGSAAIKNFGEVTTEDLGSLRPELQDDLRAEVTDALKEVQAKVKSGEIKPGENLDSEVNSALEKAHTNFFNKVKINQAEGISVEEGSALIKMNASPGEVSVIEGLPIKASSEINIPSDIDSITPDASVDTKIQVDHDEVMNAHKQLQDAYGSGDEAKIKTAQDNVTAKQEAYDANSKASLDNYQEKAVDANKESLKADDEYKQAKKGQDQNATNEAQKNKIDANDTSKTAKENQKIAERSDAQNKYTQAKEELKTAEAKRDMAEKVYGKDKPEYKEANDEVEAAQKKVDETKAELKKKLSFFQKGKLEFTARNVKSGLWSGMKSGGSLAWQHFGQSFVGGFLFTFPNMIMDSIESYYRNKALLDTLKETRQWGDIWMKIPPHLIDEEQPSNSKFFYVGLPSQDTPITLDFLKTANYYVSKPDYGNVGTYAISDPNFPPAMLHLNTGFVFTDGGQYYDPEKPTIPILQTTKEQNLVEIVNELAGEIAQGQKGYTYQYYQVDRSTGYKGYKELEAVFRIPKGADKFGFPPLLAPTMAALQNGTKFGKFLVQGVRGLDPQDPLSKALLDILTDGSGQTVGAPDEPYIAQGIYIYQTKDTPYINTIKNSLQASDPQGNAALDKLVDYVVILNSDDEIVPLQLPQSQPPANFASYVLNADAKSMVSLLDRTQYRVTPDKDGSQKMGAGPAFDIAKVAPGALAGQIELVKTFFDKYALYGPFSLGGATMTIDKALVDSKDFIYKVPGYLEGKVDDYVVALNKSATVTGLPSPDVAFFVSLVTSRFYNSRFKPYITERPYFVVTDPKNTTPYVVTGVSSAMKTVSSGKAPFYTLFTESAINPNKLPVSAYWALTHLSMGSGDEATKIQNYLTAQNPALLSAIQKSHDGWIAALDKTDPLLVSRQMGPFDFTADLVANVQIQAVSEAAIENQNFIYVSDNYPDEYLVLAHDEQLTGLAQAFDTAQPQKYAVSLSTGVIYSSQPQEGGIQSGSQISKNKDVAGLLAKVQAIKPLLPNLLKAIQDSQALYTTRIIQDIYGDNTNFGRFKFYLNKADYLNNQYIYGDVTSLGAPIDAKGNEIASVVEAINDYYIAIERVADKTQKDGYAYSFGNKLSTNTYSVVSLISGARFDADGTYLGSDPESMIGKTITNIQEFTNGVLSDISKKSDNKPIRLLSTLQGLTKKYVANLEAEKKEIADAQKQQPQPMAPMLKQALDALDANGQPKVSYIDNPNQLPRYLKYYQGKYYAVTPGYAFTQLPEGSSENSAGPDRIYIDYNLGQGKDSGTGMIYDSTGTPKLLLQGWSLLTARAYAGIAVAADGKQSKTIGISTPSLALTDAKGSSYLVKTAFPTKKQGTTTFDFYYHTQADAYFVKVTTPTTSYYIELASGYGYNLDGTPRWFESPVYKKNTGEQLFIGTDAFDVKKVALKRASDLMFKTYTMVGNYTVQMLKDYKVNGQYFEMIQDDNPDNRIRVMYANKDLNNNPLPEPFYLVWDVSDANKFTMLGKFMLDTIKYSLVSYIQTRKTGDPVTNGIFVPSDSYIDPSATPPMPKTVGIIFNANHNLIGVIYQNQICISKNGASSYYVVNDDGSKTPRTIQIIQQNQSLQPKTDTKAGISARWLSIVDGDKTYDYEYDILIINPEPEEIIAGKSSQLNLYQLKHGAGINLNADWNLNTTSVALVPTLPNVTIDPTKPISHNALASKLNVTGYASDNPSKLIFPPKITESLKAAPLNNLSTIQSDETGFLFIPNRINGEIRRFVYKFNKARDENKPYFVDAFDGWFVDISNGVLYDQTGFPVGQSLLPTQLDILLDSLQISVAYDDKGKSYLTYRMVASPSTAQQQPKPRVVR